MSGFTTDDIGKVLFLLHALVGGFSGVEKGIKVIGRNGGREEKLSHACSERSAVLFASYSVRGE